MGRQIIQQPDGRFAVHSSVSGGLSVYNATEEEIVEWFVEQQAERAREEARRMIEQIQDPSTAFPYFQFTLTWEEALAEHVERFGPLPAEEEKSDG